MRIRLAGPQIKRWRSSKLGFAAEAAKRGLAGETLLNVEGVVDGCVVARER